MKPIDAELQKQAFHSGDTNIMRIALVARSCDNETGIGRIVVSLAREFVRLKNTVHVVAQHVRPEIDGAEHHVIRKLYSFNGINKLILRYAATGVVRSLECDVVNTFGVGRSATVVTAQSCHRAGMEMLRGFRNERLWRKNLGIFDRVSLSDEEYLLTSPGTRRIIAVSNLVKDQIITHYKVKPERIVVVPNGVETSRFINGESQTKRNENRRRLSIPPDDFLLLFIGNEFDRKGLQTLIEALHFLETRRCTLLVVGDDDPAPYMKLASRLDIEDNIRFLGKVNGPEEILHVADVFVLPTLYEPFGMVIIEAMAAGVPVITSRVAGAVEGMTNGEDVVLLENPSSAEELASSITRLRLNASLRQELSESGKKQAQKFAWDRIAARTLGVYRESLHQSALS